MSAKPKRITIIVVLLFLITIGAIFSFVASALFMQLSIPSTHKTIADSISIKTGTHSLDRSYLKYGSSIWALSVLSDNFLHGGTYTYTLWMYSYQEDPEVYVCIWGPGLDGKTYQVEFSACNSESDTGPTFRSYTVITSDKTFDFQRSYVLAATLNS